MNQLRRILYPALDSLGRQVNRPLIRDKTNRTDELIAELDTTVGKVHDVLSNSRFRPHNLLSTLKYIESDEARHYESSSWVLYPRGLFAPGESQYHLWVVPVDEKIRIYGHREWSIVYPRMHMSDTARTPADPDGYIQRALDPILS